MPPAQPADPHATNPDPAPPTAGMRYHILRDHERGGRGMVSIAKDTELGRDVALKQLQDQFADDSATRQRFVLEAEITGGLEHPGIVPVYGLGKSADGRPFYAMRFVKKDNLQQAIKSFHDASPRFDSKEFVGLLRRFVAVCEAVAYAHSRGVLHCDLKPGNVMLDKYGVTFVVDWGLAKLFTPAGGARDDGEPVLVPQSWCVTPETPHGTAIGSPPYMSPEQAEGRIDQFGSATDVYGLGAMLYELLTGRAPFPDRDPGKVRRQEYPKPRQIKATVPPALEAICLKAMERRPDGRYKSAEALAAEIERWLADEPVTAYSEPIGVRLRRWVRRHARFVTGVVAALAVGLVAAGAIAVEREQKRAAVANEQAKTAKERDRALVARKRTREALDAMVSGVTGSSLETQVAISVEQKKFLLSVLHYYEEFAAEPGEDREGRERLAAAHLRLGFIRYRLGQTEEAVLILRRAGELYGKLAADFPAVPDYRRESAHSHNNLGVLLDDIGAQPEAESEYRTALAIRKKLVDDFPAEPAYRADLASCHNNLGGLLHTLGNSPKANLAYRASLEIQEKLANDFPAVPAYRAALAVSRNNLGKLLGDLGNWPEAESMYRSALAIRDKLATDFPDVSEYRADLAENHNCLGHLYFNFAKLPEAESAYRAALAICEKLVADFPGVPAYRAHLATNRDNLGAVFATLGKPATAEVEFRAALVARKRLADEYPTFAEYRSKLAQIHYNLGNLLVGQERQAEREVAYRAALGLQTRLVADHPALPKYRCDLAASHNNLGVLLEELGRRVEARAAYRAALALIDKLAADYPDVSTYRQGFEITALALSSLLITDGMIAEAVELTNRVALDPATSADILYSCAGNFALASVAANNPNAEAHADRAVALLRQAFAKGYRDFPHMLKDADFKPLRGHADFKSLLWDLADGLPPAR